MGGWYQTHIAGTGRSAALWVLIGFLLTYGVARWITRRIRARATGQVDHGKPVLHDLQLGGVHIHHQIWGMLLVLLTGLLEFRFNPASPWQEVLAALFGAGAALMLDEFALSLYLKDVYWTKDGRKSIDAVMIAAVAGLALLLGTSPIGVDAQEVHTEGLTAVSITLAINLVFTMICLLKGKLVTGLLGLPIPLLALIGATRLAKPSSFWARRWYSTPKLTKAQTRFGPHYQARRDRLRDAFSGGRKPWTTPPPTPNKPTKEPKTEPPENPDH
ncbi:hypothetical protein [Kribbella sp. NPDC003557]|uniref:hypothetical protein n=1 Tax=Kribbella sp. NPDC003557 TaxID=3154449 RepID=UPI0033B78AE5